MFRPPTRTSDTLKLSRLEQAEINGESIYFVFGIGYNNAVLEINLHMVNTPGGSLELRA